MIHLQQPDPQETVLVRLTRAQLDRLENLEADERYVSSAPPPTREELAQALELARQLAKSALAYEWQVIEQAWSEHSGGQLLAAQQRGAE